jgi:hypothetical protein
MTPPGLLTGHDQLESLFDELAEELQLLDTVADVVMVGGAWMLWHSQRASTRDVDSARRFDNDLSEAVDRVGSRHELAEGWLNDAAAAYWPSGGNYDDCKNAASCAASAQSTVTPTCRGVMNLLTVESFGRGAREGYRSPDWGFAGFRPPGNAG